MFVKYGFLYLLLTKLKFTVKHNWKILLVVLWEEPALSFVLKVYYFLTEPLWRIKHLTV